MKIYCGPEKEGSLTEKLTKLSLLIIIQTVVFQDILQKPKSEKFHYR